MQPPLPSPSRRTAGAIALLALAFTLVFGLSSVPGPLTIDDTIYHLMVRDWLATGTLEIQNGYHETPSDELQLYIPESTSQVAVHDGRLVPQYPWLTPVLALPFYALLGFHGLFWMSAVSAGLALWLSWALARRILGDERLALAATLIFGLTTFLANYAQSATPMTTGLAFTLGAWLLLERALMADGRRAALGQAAAAGLLVGLGAGTRLDVALVGPLLVVACLLSRPRHLGEALAVVVGMVPGFAVLSATNLAKFGTLSPLSYGNSVCVTAGIGAYTPIAALGLGVLAGISLLRSPAARTWMRAHLALSLACGAGVLGLVLGSAPSRQVLGELYTGLLALGVDLRHIEARGHEVTDLFNEHNAMLFFGSFKRALLQSCPALVATLAPTWWGMRGRPGSDPLMRASLLPWALLAIYGWQQYHGGGGLQLRYFLPAMPFYAIQLAAVLGELDRHSPRGTRAGLALGGALALILGLLVLPDALEPEALVLDAPLWIAAAVASSGLLWLLSRRRLTGLVATALGLGLGWGSVASLAEDLPVERGVRAQHAHQGVEIAAHIPQQALIVTSFPVQLAAALDTRGLLLAMPIVDRGADLGDLVAWYSAHGRACYSFLPQIRWDQWTPYGVFDRVADQTVWEDGDWRLSLLTPRDLPPHTNFPSAEAAFQSILDQHPHVLGVGEIHATTDGPKVPTTMSTFTRRLLPLLKGQATDLVVETWRLDHACGEQAAAVVDTVQEETKRPEETKSEIVVMAETAQGLGIKPHDLVLTCPEYQPLQDADGEVDYDALLTLLTGKLGDYAQRGLATPDAMVVLYGGAMHNDVSPGEGMEGWSYGSAARKAGGDGYIELDIYQPELLIGKDSLVDDAWAPLLRSAVGPDHVVLYQRGPGSYILLLETAPLDDPGTGP